MWGVEVYIAYQKEGGGKSVDLELFFFVKDLACHTTKNFLELDTRRNERPCPKFEIKKIEKFEKKKKIMSSKLLTDAE